MKRILFGALLAGVASSVFAADLPTRKEAPAPYIAPPIFTWTGFYIGINGGGAFGSTPSHGNGGVIGDPSGGIVGLTAGYNWQMGGLVLGVEADYDWGDISNKSTLDSAGSFAKLHVLEIATARGRLGMAWDRALIYFTGGYAGGESNGAIFDALSGTYANNYAWLNGWAIGGGLEYAFTPNVSAKAEYLFAQLNGNAIITPNYQARNGVDLSLIRGGVNFRF